MVPSLRKAYNAAFTEEKYNAFIAKLDSEYPGAIEFKIAETPVFIDKAFGNKLVDACESIVDIILDPSFKILTKDAIPSSDYVPGENDHAHMIAFDFGVCINEETGEPEPRLIEMQGFPTLFGFQCWFPEILREFMPVPANYSQYLGNYTRDTYLQELNNVLKGDCAVENVILLEIKPHEQKTRIDFYCTEAFTGIRPVCLTELIQEDKKLFYMRDGVKTAIKRIYNRVIFDELNAQKEHLGHFVDIRQELDVEWIPHPNWFYRISKYTIPFIRHPYIPATFFLNEIKQIPGDLSNYVLKPLFSFAGQGVVIDVTQADIDNITDPHNWILQRKVQYADIIETPDTPAKVEIRMMYWWKDGWARPKPAINLARLSKGKMIGVRYNKDKTWVGGSVCYFEK
ncbi:MAG: hypothetical protein QM731_13905 [Chitinophagaceae bacterium]